MKAVVQNGYGSTEHLSVKDVPTPPVKDGEILVRVRAASVNAGDLFTVKGSPYMLRLSIGFPKPKDHILGWDVAGIVESVGPGVTGFQTGDAVYGSTDRAFAEFAAGKSDHFEAKPEGLTFEDAASIPTAAITALQRLRDGGHLKEGRTILVLGASGGVGSMAVQIAKAYGCEVDGVCHSKKRDFVMALGAGRVYAYDQEDFTKSDRRYDLILDNTGRRRFSDMKRILAPDGLIMPNSGHGGMAYVFKAFLSAPFDRHIGKMQIADLENGDLKVISGLLETGSLKPHVDRTFRLAETAQAIDYLDQGHTRGKIAISIEE